MIKNLSKVYNRLFKFLARFALIIICFGSQSVMADSYQSISTGNSSSESVINNVVNNSGSQTYISNTANGQNRTVFIDSNGTTSTTSSVVVKLFSDNNGTATSSITVQAGSGRYRETIKIDSKTATATYIHLTSSAEIVATSVPPLISKINPVPCQSKFSLWSRLNPLTIFKHSTCLQGTTSPGVYTQTPNSPKKGWVHRFFSWIGL